MSRIPPGIVFLARCSPALALPPIASALVLRYAAQRHDMYIPLWVTILVCVSSIPLVLSARILLRDMRYRREAASIGAVLPTRLTGKWLGGVDLLIVLYNSFKNGYPGDVLWEAMETKGTPIDIHLLWDYSIITYNPDHIKTILATDAQNYEKGAEQRDMLHSVLGTGVFNSDGDMWKFHRSMTRPFFSRERIGDFDIFARHADEIIKKMKERFHAGYAVDFQDAIARFTLDSATEFLFGSCVHSVASELPYPHGASSTPLPKSAADTFAEAFSKAQFAIADRTRIGAIWPLFEFWKDKAIEPMKIVDAYLEPILKAAIERAKHQAGSGERKNGIEIDENETLLDHLVRTTLDPIVLHDETLNILIAGRDTTAATLTFIVYLLSTHPDVFSTLREEVLSKVGSSRLPDYEDIRQLRFMRAIINETLRLYPAVPFDLRYNTKATTWMNPADPQGRPIYIPANSPLSWSAFIMHRRKEYWGPDAEEFDPTRWLDERTQKYLVRNPFIFVPFNAGPRICLGQQFAYNEMSFFLVRLCQNFSTVSLDLLAQPPYARPPKVWANATGRRKSKELIIPKVHLTMYISGGLWVKMDDSV